MGHYWRSKDEVISNIHLWTPSHGWAKAGWLARTYIQQLCANTGYSLEDLPGAMDNRDKWQDRVRDIRASSATWWWWYTYIIIYIYICIYILPLAGLQGYILYPHIAAECMFELVVLLLPGHMWGSIGVHHLWARPCFSSSVLHVWLV